MIPDRKLLQQISRAESSSSGGSSSSSSSRKIDPYLDFFLALAICNTVVVSMATAQRQRVSFDCDCGWEIEMEGRVKRGKMDAGFVFSVCKLTRQWHTFNVENY